MLRRLAQKWDISIQCWAGIEAASGRGGREDSSCGPVGTLAHALLSLESSCPATMME